ncbi:hypothetical protein D9M73_245360 [compost metagenome]
MDALAQGQRSERFGIGEKRRVDFHVPKPAEFEQRPQWREIEPAVHRPVAAGQARVQLAFGGPQRHGRGVQALQRQRAHGGGKRRGVGRGVEEFLAQLGPGRAGAGQ